MTLVELLVAMVVLVVGVAGALAAWGRILEGVTTVVTSAQATFVAQRMLAELELQRLAGGPMPAEHGVVGRYSWTRVCTPDAEQPPRPLETWVSTVTWPVRRQTRQMQLSRVWWTGR